MTTDELTQKWNNRRNTIMTIANLASHAASRAPSPYELLYRLGFQRRRSRAMRAASCAGLIGVGMAMGGGLAMLFAPRSGPETRERLSERAKRARDYVAPSEDSEGQGLGSAPSSASSARGTRRV